MSGIGGSGLRNRRAVPLATLPTLGIAGFRESVVDAVRTGWRVISLFGAPEPEGRTRLFAVLGRDATGELDAACTLVDTRYPALTPDCPQVHYFEREIAEQCGILPEGHLWLKPVRRHPPDHAARLVSLDPPFDRERYPFFQIDRDDIHEVAVGPVHAGIIEPGHFRLQAHGEEVLHLEIMLGYQHRGVERLLVGADSVRAMLVAESIAGDTVLGHGMTYCGVMEALTGCRTPARAHAIQGIALELERLANHIGDLGAMAGDVAYQPAAAYFGRMRGECLNLLMALTGNRYGRGLVRPGGTLFDLPPEMAAEFVDRLVRLQCELPPVAALLLENTSVQARFEGVGVLARQQCLDLGIVGVAARACEVGRDVRHDFPFGIYRFAHIPVATAWAGDVLARALVRWIEIKRSLDFVLEQLLTLPKGPHRAVMGPPAPNHLAVAMTEGWRGEIVHVAVTGEDGAFRRYKVVDPSFHNWNAVAAVLPGNQISDFPLCNKSFNLSYAGHDL